MKHLNLREPWKTVARGALLTAVVGGLLMGAIRKGDVELSPVPVAVLALLALLTILASTLQTWRKWRGLDEAAQRARLVDSFWGGSVAMGAAAFTAIFSLYGFIRIDIAAPALSDNGALFGLGIATCLLIQTIGCFVGWAIWWLRASR